MLSVLGYKGLEIVKLGVLYQPKAIVNWNSKLKKIWKLQKKIEN